MNHKNSWLEIIRKSDIVFHLAGNTSITEAEKNPKDSFASTIDPIMNLIYASNELSCKPRMVFASTATIYGLTKELPITEFHPPNPITQYDLHKFIAEQRLQEASSNNLIDAISLRLANVYGPSLKESSANDRGILSKVTRMCFENKDIQFYGEGDYLRDYIYIDDVVSAFLHASVISYDEIRKKSEIIFNVSSGEGTSIKNAFNLISSKVELITGNKLRVNSTPWPHGVTEIEKRNFIGSSSRLKLLSDWSPKKSLEEGISSLVNHYSKEYI